MRPLVYTVRCNSRRSAAQLARSVPKCTQLGSDPRECIVPEDYIEHVLRLDRRGSLGVVVVSALNL